MLLLLTTIASAADPYGGYLTGFALNASDEYAMGKAYSETDAWLTGVWENPTQQLRVERICRELVAASDRPDLVVNVTLLDTSEVNASAYPGGFLLVNRGILELLDDPQLAFVIGHELSHAILRHGVNAMNLAAAAKTVTSLQASRAAGDRTTAAQQARDLRLLSAGYSRQQELEADMYGMLYAVRAGWDAQASIDSMATLKKAFPDDFPPEFAAFADHPTFTDRIAKLQAGRDNILATLHQFDEGVAFFHAGRTAPAVRSFQQFLTLFPHCGNAWANLGAAWMQQVPGTLPWKDVLPLHASSGQRVRSDATVARERAVDAIQHALAIDPYDPVAIGLFGVLALRDGQPDHAYELLARAHTLAPDSAAILVDLGNAAAALGKEDEALKHWDEAHALAADLAEPLVNVALMQEQRKKKKPAIAAWTAVAALPGWQAEAESHLATLGEKRAKAAAAAAPTLEQLTVGKTKVGVRTPVDDVVAALGPPVYQEAPDEDGYSYLVWDTLSVVAQNGRVLGCLLAGDSDLKTTGGVGIGSPATALQPWGVPTTSFTLGAVDSRDWVPRGVAVSLLNDEVAEIELYLPE
jgi:predicted Zn-dependent protease